MQKMNRVYRAVAVVALLGMTTAVTTGCFGSFQTVQKVYRFNDQVNTENKWVREGVFLLLNIPFVPVYGIATVLDVVFMNSAEFWTGQNPMAAMTETATGENGEMASLTHNPDGTLDLMILEADGSRHFMKLVRNGDTLTAIDEHGRMIGKVARKGDGAELIEGMEEEGE